jgi:hypothetical protein
MSVPGVKSDLYASPPSHPWNILPADQDHPDLSREGTWTEVTDPTAMGVCYIESNTTNDRLTLTWQGVGLWLWAYFGPDCGRADIQIDDRTVRTIDFYAKTARKDILWLAVALDKLDADGNLVNHTCKITVKGTKNDSSSDYYLRIDGFEREIDPGALQTRTIIEQIVTTKVSEFLGRTDYASMLEVAPWTGRYQASPADLTEGEWAAALADIKGRLKVTTDSTAPVSADVSDRWARQLGQVDLARYLGVAPSHTNPFHTRISDGVSAFIDPRDVSDRWARQLGQVDLARVLGAALSSTNPVITRIVRDALGNYGLDLTHWAGTTLTGRDITTLLDHLNVDLDTRASEATLKGRTEKLGYTTVWNTAINAGTNVDLVNTSGEGLLDGFWYSANFQDLRPYVVIDDTTLMLYPMYWLNVYTPEVLPTAGTTIAAKSILGEQRQIIAWDTTNGRYGESYRWTKPLKFNSSLRIYLRNASASNYIIRGAQVFYRTF